MGKNDWHVAPDGRFARGLVTEKELEGVIGEVDDLEAMKRVKDRLEEQLNYLHNKEQPMLKGTGFIVVDPKSGRFPSEEFTDVEQAKAEGSNVAYQSGTAIIYAPVLVMRPRRETADSQPSALLKQLGLPDGANVGQLPSPNAPPATSAT